MLDLTESIGGHRRFASRISSSMSMTSDALPFSPYCIRRAARGFGDVGDLNDFFLFRLLHSGSL